MAKDDPRREHEREDLGEGVRGRHYASYQEAATPLEFKRFLVDRISEQARRDGGVLTQAELHMLSWSESDPDFEGDPNLAAEVADPISEAQFERKIAGLLRRAYDQDCAIDQNAKEVYSRAAAKLLEGDHYLSVMIEQALGPLGKKRNWWWPF